MSDVACASCAKVVEAQAPNPAYWALVGAFWVVSLLFGIGTALGSTWGFMFLVAWVLLATTAGGVVQRAMAWSCAACGSEVPAPVTLTEAHA